MDYSTPSKKRKTGESIPSIKKAHKEAKNSGAHKLRELYSAAKSLASLDDSFSEPTQHQPCDNSLYEEFMENSQERVHNDIGSTDTESSSPNISLGSSSNSASWSQSSGSSDGVWSSSSRSGSVSPFWKKAKDAAAKTRNAKTKKSLSVDDFFDVQKDYLPFEEEKTEWADDTYLKQIVCCCFFKWWK